MPQVIKQKPPRLNRLVPTAPSTNGVLSRIGPIPESKIGRLKVSLYGNPKTGKTRLASTFPKPLLIIGTEDGTASIMGTEGVDFVQLVNCAEMQELVDGPVASGRWATVVLDNGTKLRDMRISEILGLKEVALQKGWGFASREQWIECANSLKELLNPLLDLPRKIDLNVVIIAQEQDFTSERTVASDLIRPVIGSALGESVCRFVNAECDYVCQTFIRRQMIDKKIKSAGGAESVQRVPTGRNEFCLRVGPHDIFWTGFRQSINAKPLPECIVDPTYEKIRQLIEGQDV